MAPLSLGIISDEISQDFKEALRHGLQWGVGIYEIRCLKSGRLPLIDQSEFEEVLELIGSRGVTVSAVSPGIFKHPLSKMKVLEEELAEVLPRTIEMAKRLHTSLIIVFGFQKPKDEPGNFWEAVKVMERASAAAEREGMQLCVENEPGFWCDSGANTAALIRSVGSKALGANWDPCNGYGTSERPYPEGYRAIKDFIFNVHVKDTMEGSLIRCVPVGEGAIDWKGQLRALVNDHPVHHVSIETHCLPLIEKSKQNIDTLRMYLDEIMRTERVTS